MNPFVILELLLMVKSLLTKLKFQDSLTLSIPQWQTNLLANYSLLWIGTGAVLFLFSFFKRYKAR